MVFTDLLFLFAFLPIASVIILITGEPWEKNLAALVCSLVFMLWGRPWYFSLVLLPALAVYFVGRLSNKPRFNLISSLTSVAVWLACLVLAILSCADSSLSENIWAVAYLLMALKSTFYLRDIENGKQCEKSPLNLLVYLCSYEFMLLNPALDYFTVSDKINERKTKLANMSVGIKSFTVGLFTVGVFGLVLDRLRTAALAGSSLPWLNVLIVIVCGAAEIYILTIGYMKLSHGICMVNGIYTETAPFAFSFNFDLSKHFDGVCPDLTAQIKKHFGGKKSCIVLLILSALTAGVCIALGIGGGTALAIAVACLAILLAPSDKSGAFEKVFTLVLYILGLVFAVFPSVTGVANLIAVDFSTSLSQELFDELSRTAPWAVIALISLSSLPSQLAGVIRMKLMQTQKGYALYRVFSLVLMIVLLTVSLIAVISFS